MDELNAEIAAQQQTALEVLTASGCIRFRYVLFIDGMKFYSDHMNALQTSSHWSNMMSNLYIHAVEGFNSNGDWEVI